MPAPNARILIVDTNKAFLEDVQRHLLLHFGRVVTMSDPEAAARHLEGGERYDVVLFEVLLSPISGLQLLKLVRSLDPYTQTIMLAAHASMQTAVRALQLGALDYVEKPIRSWEALINSIQRALKERTLKVENARLMFELRESNEELQRGVALLRDLNEVSAQMHQARNVEHVLNILVKSATKYLQAERVSIMIRDPGNDKMGILVAEGIDRAVVESLRVDAPGSVAAKVVREGVPMVVNNASGDPRVPQRDQEAKPYRGQSFCCVPISTYESDTKVMGVVNITDRLEDKPFSDAEVEFITYLARQAAFAMTSAALFRTQKKAAK